MRFETVYLITPNATCFEQFNYSSEEFLSMLRFDQRSKLEELQEKIDRTGQDDQQSPPSIL